MEAKTLEALNKCIEHWEEDNVKAKTPERASVGSKNCALCDLFNTSESDLNNTNCIRCPVREKTKRKYCEGSPYHKACGALEDWSFKRTDETKNDFHAASQEMVDFLKSLLPENSNDR